ncbi:hypothetical protein F5X71_07345 [Nocardia brasiliensis]|uniref:Uncharacterized protein n=1 Tax=Nocardia brasiliensis TaxID=37326 RepID=A0A6G9XMK8_NOCBR|nr:hypothetical protein F5X71_07345 [Nocardia brasiliensis]
MRSCVRISREQRNDQSVDHPLEIRALHGFFLVEQAIEDHRGHDVGDEFGVGARRDFAAFARPVHNGGIGRAAGLRDDPLDGFAQLLIAFDRRGDRGQDRIPLAARVQIHGADGDQVRTQAAGIR